MNLAEFIDLLNRQKLYFCRIDKLKEIDPWEGGSLLLSKENNDGTKNTSFNTEKNQTANNSIIMKAPKYNFVSCWHRNPSQSMAMWQIYAEKGIAIKSAKTSLKKSLNTNGTVEVPSFGDVVYIDTLKERFNHANDYFHKLKCYEFEREFRAVITKTGIGTDEKGEINCIDSAFVAVDLCALISEVYVSPLAESFYENVINSLLEKYNLKFKVIRSDIKEMVAW